MHYLQTALINAIEAKELFHVIDLATAILRDKELNLEFFTQDGKSLIQLATESKNDQIVDFILPLTEHRIFLHVDKKGKSLLHVAVEAEDVRVMLKAIDASIRAQNSENFVNRADEQGQTALHYAFARNSPKIFFTKLAEHGADISLHDDNGKLPHELATNKIDSEKYSNLFKKIETAQPFQYQLLEKDRLLLINLIKEFEEYQTILWKKEKDPGTTSYIIPAILGVAWATNILKSLFKGNVDIAHIKFLGGSFFAVGYLLYSQANPARVSFLEYRHLTQHLDGSVFLNRSTTDNMYHDTANLYSAHSYLSHSLEPRALSWEIMQALFALKGINRRITTSGKPFAMFLPKKEPAPMLDESTPSITCNKT